MWGGKLQCNALKVISLALTKVAVKKPKELKIRTSYPLKVLRHLQVNLQIQICVSLQIQNIACRDNSKIQF